MWRAPVFSREQRLAMAHRLVDELRAKYGDRLVAVRLEGSVAKGLDVPESDLEMTVILEGGAERWHAFLRDGMFIGLGYSSPEKEEAGNRELAAEWPVSGDTVVHSAALYDPRGLLATLREQRRQVEAAADYRPLVRGALADLHEYVLKLMSLRTPRPVEAAIFAGGLAYWALHTVGLANRHRYLSTRSMFEESCGLASLPAGYRDGLEALLRANGDLPAQQDATARLWSSFVAWARVEHGVDLADEGQEL